MATIIDSLLVTLGLDSKPYKKGKDDATRDQKALKENTKKSSGEMVASLKAVALQVGAMVVGFQSLRGAVSFLAGINNADAALGRLAANTGTNVRELNEWGLAVELAGGSVDDAKSDVSNLASSITALKATGDVSPLILLMQRLGVAIFDAEGNARDLFDIMSDAGAKLSQFNRADAFQLGKGAGMSEGTLNLLLMEEDARRRILEQARANNNMDEAAAARAADLQRQWRDIAQGAREFGRELLEVVTPAVSAFFGALKTEPLTKILEGLNEARVGESLAVALNAFATAVERFISALPQAQQFTTEAIEFVDRAVGTITNEEGDDREFLENLQFSDSPKDAVRRQNVENVRRLEGVRAAALFAREQQRIIAGQRGSGRGDKTAGAPTTTVQIDEINVNTQATDAEGIAAELPGALARKGVVAQADTGMN